MLYHTFTLHSLPSNETFMFNYSIICQAKFFCVKFLLTVFTVFNTGKLESFIIIHVLLFLFKCDVCLVCSTFVIPANSRGGEKHRKEVEDGWMLSIGLVEEN